MRTADRQLYVYYHLPEADLPAVLAAVSALQAGLKRDHPGLHCTVLRRPEAPDRRVTLMERYAPAHGARLDFAAIEAALAEAVAAAGPALPLPRHTEHFDLLPS